MKYGPEIHVVYMDPCDGGHVQVDSLWADPDLARKYLEKRRKELGGDADVWLDETGVYNINGWSED